MILRSFKIIFSLFVLLLAGVLSMSAQQVTEKAALSKAKKFLNRSDVVSRRAARKTPQLTLANSRHEFYVFNDDANGGYVVVAGDDCMPDVLGYSYTGHFDAANIPCNMKAWLEDYANQVEYLRTHPEAQVTRRTATERKEITPLLNCHFNQGKYYNEKCPIVNGEHCVTGCVATAMAQILYYYQWPEQTTKTIPAYTSSGKIDMPAIPVTTIDWDNMLNEYINWKNYSEKQIDAISTLMLLCGTSVKMSYTLYGSGAPTYAAARAFRMYFDYDDLTEIIDRGVNLDVWEQMIYDELNNNRPVLYSGNPANGDGHAFVLDGYRDGYFHVNFGWGGSDDNYFLLTNIHGYNYSQEAIVGIQPFKIDNLNRYAVLDNSKMTLFYDKEMSHRSGTILSRKDDWSDYTITECVIDPSFANLQLNTLQEFFSDLSQSKSIEGIENLNISKVTNMLGMFAYCSSLTSLDLSVLNTSKVTNMAGMFYGCSSLTSLDLSGFKTDNVTRMNQMFEECNNLTSLDVSSFKTDNVMTMSFMFSNCNSLTSLDLSNFKTDNVTDMDWMFYGCSNLSSLDVSSFKTDNVTDMDKMFYGCSSLTSLDVSGFKTNNVKYMNNMFENCCNLTSLDVSGFKTDNVKDMSYMFNYCENLTSLDVSGFKTGNVKDMSFMFWGCSGLTNLDVSGFKTDNVTNMSGMFLGCSSLTSLDVSGFKTNNVTNMSYMFGRCSGLTSLNLSSFKTDNVTDMNSMFLGCSSLTSLDVSNFKTDNVKDMNSMFGWCINLSTIYASERWNMSNVQTADNMFEWCTNIWGGSGTTYDENHIDGDYAHIDEGISNPGYFTYKVPIIPGDVNGDGLVNVTDIVATVNFIMEKPSDNFNKEAADLNGDGEVNVTDIVKMVSIIMDASAREMAE